MIYIYRRKFSEGARDLAETLNDLGCPAKYTQGKALERFRNDRDALICWGDVVPALTRGLNGAPLRNKLQDALTLQEKGVPTITASVTEPREEPREINLPPTIRNKESAREALRVLQDFIEAANPVRWLERSLTHVGGDDLLHGVARPGMWVRKENIQEEYRLHVFHGKSIRAGKKAPRPDVPQHPWVRSHEGGWFVDYAGFKSTRPMRHLAAQAVEALNLDFGAVDLALLQDQSMIVLEVNRAPGLEGNTLTAYAEAIMRGKEENPNV